MSFSNRPLPAAASLLLAACAHGGLDAADADSGAPVDSSVAVDASPAVDADASASVDSGVLRDADACAPQPVPPWDGVSAVYAVGSTATILSADRYWTVDLTAGTWGAHGHLETVWAAIPTVDGSRPWDAPGIATAYPYETTLTVLSADRYWVYDFGAAAWQAEGHVETLWAGAPTVDGLEPWKGAGVTASWISGTTQTIVSADRFWTLDRKSGVWGATGHLETLWANAPAVDGLRPWDGSGVRTGYVSGSALIVVSGDRYWTEDISSATWTASGHLEQVWAMAPTLDPCGVDP